MNVDVYNLSNQKTGTVELPDGLFSAPWRPLLVAQVVRAIQANKRRPWANAKDRSEVRGGGKKPWKQKGTGRARHGSTRSPIWKGGGVTHGPLSERDYSQKINKKMRREALASVLSKKLKENEVRVVDAISVTPSKTKVIATALRGILNIGPRQKTFSVLIVRDPSNNEITRAARNLVQTKVVSPDSINIEDALCFKTVLFDKNAIEALRSRSK